MRRRREGAENADPIHPSPSTHPAVAANKTVSIPKRKYAPGTGFSSDAQCDASSGWTPSLSLTFLLLSALRIAAALLSPIADCDETFNYWEPMHYIMFNYGLQTWEYSPQFALRSYAYLMPYAGVASISMYISELVRSYVQAPFLSSKIIAFYAVRVVQGIACASAETYFYSAVMQCFGSRVARWLLLFLASSPGIFRAAVEFLPSSFAMICLTAAFAAWMLGRFFMAVFLVALASLLGWVFAAALAIPMAIHILMRKGGVSMFILYATVSGILILGIMTPIDTYYFGKIVVAPLNHVLYNVFPPDGAGPDIFGREPWTFYGLNLALNCNVSALLLAVYPFLFLFDYVAEFFQGDAAVASSEKQKRFVYLSPCYVWLFIFFNQPHKEERFLAPCYTFISLIAAVAIHDCFELFTRIISGPYISNTSAADSNTSTSRKSLPAWARILKGTAVITVAALTVAVGMSRTTMQVKAFNAPMRIFTHLSEVELMRGIGPKNAVSKNISLESEVNICIGQEWYRFPTSFILPDSRFRVRFTKSGFSGLLPQYFSEEKLGTRILPTSMNGFNMEEPSQYYDFTNGEGCHYFVDLDLSHRGQNTESGTAKVLPIPEESRQVIASYSFLDTEYSPAGYRAFFLPGLQEQLVQGQYQLIRNLELLPIGHS